MQFQEYFLPVLFILLVFTVVENISASESNDFNGDNITDLAIGVPSEDLSNKDTGAVNVIYGTLAGLDSIGYQLWSQDSRNIVDSAEENDHFGSSLSAGDFNGDNITDLAIGVPSEDSGIRGPSGGVNIIYGSLAGLDASKNQFWSQDNTTIKDNEEGGDYFGSSLSAGDFNGDNITDLAIGVPSEDLSYDDTGAVNVIYGSISGLNESRNQLWSQDVPPNIEGWSSPRDHFGSSLSAGDFNGDNITDLAIGVPYDNFYGQYGAVNVIYGSISGLNESRNQLWSQNSPAIMDDGEIGDHFGSSLSAGDFNGDNITDLAIGVPSEDLSNKDTGAVNVIYGTLAGLDASKNQLWTQNSLFGEGSSGKNDHFGSSLSAGDFNGDNITDLAIGVPRLGFHEEGDDQVDCDVPDTCESIGDSAVNVIYGTLNGLEVNNSQIWTQDNSTIKGNQELGDYFGSSLSAGDFNGDNITDLAIGVPSEDLSQIIDTGAVNVIYGSISGLNESRNQLWSQDIEREMEEGDTFGRL
ncbi:MAG: hypothetical protein AB7V56_12515 [Candidatus Nitrosocosmicus sp.]